MSPDFPTSITLAPSERAILDTWSSERRMEYEELAATLEYVQGLSRVKAERIAFERMRQWKA